MKTNLFKRVLWLVIPLLTVFSTNVWSKTVTYTITSTSAVSTSGTAPTGSSATFAATYTDKNQITASNSQTLTLKNFGVVAITNITLSMKSNASSGAGSLYYSTDGGTTKTYLVSSSGSKFNTTDWYGAWSSSYVNVSKDVAFLTQSGKNLVIRIDGTVNSIFCASYTITYVDETYTVNYNAGSGTCKASDTQATVGGAITLPTPTLPAGCIDKGWEFAGWKKTSAQTSTTTEPVLYTGSYVPSASETLYAVYKQSNEREGCTEGKITATAGLAAGDVVILYYENGKVQYDGTQGDTYGHKTSYTTTPAQTHILDVCTGNASDKFAFYDRTDKKYLALNSSGNSLHTADAITANSSWTISISSGNATITNASFTDRILQYNNNASGLRFACYTGSQASVQLYKVCPPIYTYISNCTFDYFVDNMHGNETTTQQGTYSMPAALSDADKGDDYCAEKHYHFVGWLSEAYVNADGSLKSGYEDYLYEPGHSGHTANNTTYYAIWVTD